MKRGRLTVLVTTPKFPLPNVPFGGPNWGWLKRLKNSDRNSIFILSPIEVFLNTAKSKLTTPCCRSVGSTRGSSPKPYAGGSVKQLVLNHCDTRETELPEVDLLHPGTTLGLKVPVPRLRAVRELPLPSLIFTGKPR